MTSHAPRGRHAAALTDEERFLFRVQKTETCWLWKDSSSIGRYGEFKVSGRSVLAHRWSYEHFIGRIPGGMEIDHLCRVTNCVRPDHLQPVTGRENKLRGDTLNALNASKQQCLQGHPFDAANTHRRSDGTRKCRACHREAQRRYLQRKGAS